MPAFLTSASPGKFNKPKNPKPSCHLGSVHLYTLFKKCEESMWYEKSSSRFCWEGSNKEQGLCLQHMNLVGENIRLVYKYWKGRYLGPRLEHWWSQEWTVCFSHLNSVITVHVLTFPVDLRVEEQYWWKKFIFFSNNYFYWSHVDLIIFWIYCYIRYFNFAFLFTFFNMATKTLKIIHIAGTVFSMTVLLWTGFDFCFFLNRFL